MATQTDRKAPFMIQGFFYRPEVGKFNVIPLAHRGPVSSLEAESQRKALNLRLRTAEFQALTDRLGYIPHVSTLHITENVREGRVLAQAIGPQFEVV